MDHAKRLLRPVKRALRGARPAPPAPPSPEETLPVAELRQFLTDMRWELRQQRKILDTLRLVETAPVLDEVQSFAAERQLGFGETVQTLVDRPLSFARFGDGEMRLLLRSEYTLKFQPNSPELQRGLRDALTAPPQDHLLKGFPHVYRDLHWSGVWGDVWRQVKELIPPGESFGNSHVTRPIYFQVMGQRGVDLWRAVWENQRVSIITGEGSRFELIPQLFDNLKDATTIPSQPVDAWSDVPRLVDVVDRLAPGQRADLYLIALGPAGTVLTHRLAQLGVRALDVGHLSDSYLTAFEGGAWPESKGVVRPQEP